VLSDRSSFGNEESGCIGSMVQLLKCRCQGLNALDFGVQNLIGQMPRLNGGFGEASGAILTLPGFPGAM